MGNAHERHLDAGSRPPPVRRSSPTPSGWAAAAPAPDVPQCRAGWTRHLLEGLRNQPASVVQRARDAVPAPLLRQVEESLALRWLPFEAHMSVLGALRSTLGARAYQQLCREQIFDSLHLPALFAKPARAALQLYGAGPFAMFRAIPVSLRYIFRDAGDFSVHISPGGRELTACYADFPPAFSQGDTWSLIWIATFEAIGQYVLEGQELRAEVSLVRHAPERGYFEWHAGLAPPKPRGSSRPPL